MGAALCREDACIVYGTSHIAHGGKSYRGSVEGTGREGVAWGLPRNLLHGSVGPGTRKEWNARGMYEGRAGRTQGEEWEMQL